MSLFFDLKNKKRGFTHIPCVKIPEQEVHKIWILQKKGAILQVEEFPSRSLPSQMISCSAKLCRMKNFAKSC